MDKNDGAASLVRSDALLGCPFCGEKAHSKKLPSGFIVGCYTTGCFAEVFEDDYETITWTTRRKAVEAWNHRANARLDRPETAGRKDCHE